MKALKNRPTPRAGAPRVKVAPKKEDEWVLVMADLRLIVLYARGLIPQAELRTRLEENGWSVDDSQALMESVVEARWRVAA